MLGLLIAAGTLLIKNKTKNPNKKILLAFQINSNTYVFLMYNLGICSNFHSISMKSEKKVKISSKLKVTTMLRGRFLK